MIGGTTVQKYKSDWKVCRQKNPFVFVVFCTTGELSKGSLSFPFFFLSRLFLLLTTHLRQQSLIVALQTFMALLPFFPLSTPAPNQSSSLTR